MKDTARLAALTERLRTLQGCRPDDEVDYLPSFWNGLQRQRVEPETLRHPQDYTGGEGLSIACTPAGSAGAPAKRRWWPIGARCCPRSRRCARCGSIPDVPQELFDAACRMPGLQSLWIKWSGIQHLDALPQLAGLQHLYIGASGQRAVARAAGQACPGCSGLQLSGIGKVPSLEFCRSLPQLVGLGYTGGDGKPIIVPSFEPLAGLRQLQWLHLGSVRAADGSLRPLGDLDQLRWLGLANAFDMAQFAWLSTRLPHTLCDWLGPYHRAHRSLFPCRTCKANWRVMTSGKGKQAAVPQLRCATPGQGGAGVSGCGAGCARGPGLADCVDRAGVTSSRRSTAAHPVGRERHHRNTRSRVHHAAITCFESCGSPHRRAWGAASAFGQAPQAKRPPEPVQFVANAPIPVTLQPAGRAGQDRPRHGHQRQLPPQVRFQSAPAEFTCKLDLPPAMSGLEPGAASTAALRCDGAVRIDPKKPDFKAFEGGKQVGFGAVGVRVGRRRSPRRAA